MRIQSAVDYVRGRDVISVSAVTAHEIVNVGVGETLVAGRDGATIPGAPGWRGSQTRMTLIPSGVRFRLVSRGNAWDPAIWEVDE